MGDILTVQGKVALPKGVEPGGTEVFPQTYREDDYHVKTTAEDGGFFVLPVRVSRDDDTFELRTAPTDLYVAGARQPLPITPGQNADQRGGLAHDLTRTFQAPQYERCATLLESPPNRRLLR
ncbi:hypothetical protein ACFXKC_58235 [Streptomyces sp. NPDC059340]|uniref:hypothetical protein n=1 Tax=Streptomyces sp. NPDC059340 TaxID=3346806 RepID=UPI0036B92DE0